MPLNAALSWLAQALPGFAPRAPAQADTSAATDPAADLNSFFYTLYQRILDPEAWMQGLGTLLQMLLIAALTLLFIRLVDRLTEHWTRRFADLPALHPRRQRALTISNLLSSSARYLVWPLALIMILSELHIDVGALIATAGVAGLAIGFGAQTLVKDVINGIFLLFDDTIHVGDRIQVKGAYCIVEYIGIRLIKARQFDGELVMIPAGELRIFGNTSIGYMRVVVETRLSYEQDADAILPVMERVANEWAEEHRDILLEEKPTVQALTNFGESGVHARIVVQVKPGEQFQAERDLRMLLKRAFDRLGIEIPLPQRTVHMRPDDAPPPRQVTDPEAPAAHDGDGTAQGSD